jgi:antitoxin (DNA-binding transcriptional repressor) of toxin-antitoxin stability system
MKKVSITEAKDNLAALIDGLKTGSPVLIIDHGRAVARLEYVTSSCEPDDDHRTSVERNNPHHLAECA